MTIYSWKGVKGDWSDAADWTPNAVPNNSRAIVDIPSGTVTISTGENFQAGSVSLSGTSGALALDGTGALSVSGDFFCNVGGGERGALATACSLIRIPTMAAAQ
jgi:hypothetical protein